MKLYGTAAPEVAGQRLVHIPEVDDCPRSSLVDGAS